MAYQKTQGYQALNILVTDNANIPYTTVASKGKSDSIAPNQLIAEAGAAFTKTAYTGDIVYNTTTGTAATVIDVVDSVTLKLNANIFLNVGGQEDYILYSASAVTNYQDANNGCVLYIGESGDLTVDTITGDEKVLFSSVPIGFFPVQVKKVWGTGTTAKKLVALW